MAQLFSVEERGVIFSLDDFTEENFDICNIINRVTASASGLLPDQFEVLTNLHQGEEVQGGSLDMKQFHPEPFLFIIENQIDMLNQLRVKSEQRLLTNEASVKRYEIEHQQRLQQLNNTVDGILTNFHKLEKRVNKIVHTSMSAGQSIESASQAQDQARFAQFIIRCFLDLNTGDLSRVDPILISHDERRLIEAGQLIQLLQNISDELNVKTSKQKPLGLDDGSNRMIPIDESNEEDDSTSSQQHDDTGLFGVKKTPAEITQLPNGGTQSITITVEGNVQKTTTCITNPDGTTTTTIERVEITTVGGTNQYKPRISFETAAKTIYFLSQKIESKLIEKFRVCTQHKDYPTALKFAEVLYTFKESHYIPPRGSDPTFLRAFYGKKFFYYSHNVVSAMRIPKQVDRKDLSSPRVFTLWFTRVITSIIDVLRDQCHVLPLIIPNAIQTFEDIVIAVFQHFLPPLIEKVHEHPSLTSNEAKSLRTRATMLDLTRRAICEVLCMIEDLSKAVEKRNLEQRQRAIFSNESVKSKQSVQGGLMYQLTAYQQQLQSTELGNALDDNSNTNASLQQSLYSLFHEQENGTNPSLIKNTQEQSSYTYGYLSAATQSISGESNNTSKLAEFSKNKNSKNNKKSVITPSSLSNSTSLYSSSSSSSTTTTTPVVNVPQKSLTDIDNCFTAELAPISSLLRDNMISSINDFAKSWFDKEDNYIRASLKQVREDLLLSKFELETRLKTKMDANRVLFSVPKEILVEIKEERRLWLQERIMDLEPIDFIFKLLQSAIKRAQVISSPQDRPDQIQAIFLVVADFLYSQYLYPLVSEAILRYSPWGQQLLRWNSDYFDKYPSNFAQDIPIIYTQESYKRHRREQNNDDNKNPSSPTSSSSSSSSNPSSITSPPPPPQVQYFYNLNTMQQQFQLHSILPNLGTEQIEYIRYYILQSSNVQVNDLTKISNVLKNAFLDKKDNTNHNNDGESSSSSSTTTTTTSKDKDNKDKDTKEPHEKPLQLSHDEIMLDLIFILTILKSCIDIDKRLSSFLVRVVMPHLQVNLTMRSLAQARLDTARSSLEGRIRQYLTCYAVYISYGFDSIIKLIPYGHYKVKTVDNVAGTTKVTALWIQAAQLIESTAAAIIASLAGLNIDDFLQYFIQQIMLRLLVCITDCGGVSQLGAPLLLQDLAHIQRPINTIGIPYLITKVQELRNMSFLFFAPYNGIRSFLAERLGVMHIDLELVTTLVKARADYSTYRTQLQQQLQAFSANLAQSTSGKK